MAYNYAAAFAAFCKSAPLEEIAVIFEIPVESLERKAKEEHWHDLRASLPLASNQVALVGEDARLDLERKDKIVAAKMELIERNRRENLAIAMMLRDDLVSVLLEMRKPEGLKLKRYWHNRGSIVEKDCEMSLTDRTALANYATLIASLTYTALGDTKAAGGRQDGPDGANSGTPSITIILPGAVATPRSERNNLPPLEGNVTLDLRDSDVKKLT